MSNKNMIGFLDRSVLGVVLFIPIFYLDGLGTITGRDYSSFQG